MGSWDVGSFDNDTACDWTYELEGITDFSLIRHTLHLVVPVPHDTDLDADLACRAVAAADVLARLLDGKGERNSYTETVDRWVANQKERPSALLVDQSITALRRIASPQSELLELWEEEGGEEWRAEIDALIGRLASFRRPR